MNDTNNNIEQELINWENEGGSSVGQKSDKEEELNKSEDFSDPPGGEG